MELAVETVAEANLEQAVTAGAEMAKAAVGVALVAEAVADWEGGSKRTLHRGLTPSSSWCRL